MKWKVLNLYAGIGGNRKLWNNVDVTAVEIDTSIAKVYSDFFPDDTMIVSDAHQYLKEHYKDDWNFIWSSPPCQDHSSFRQNLCVRFRGTEAEYPDMKLYQEILFLKYNFPNKWVVENVNPYYEPLIKAVMLQRHLFWSNFPIYDVNSKQEDIIRHVQIPDLQKIHGFNLDEYKIKDKRQILRNCINPELGKYILDCARKNVQLTDWESSHRVGVVDDW
jgi:DNA (cytosine-5)-methyltransferase 1